MRRLSFEEKDLSTKSLIAFIFSFIVVELYFVSPIYFIIKYNNRYIKKRHLPIYQISKNLIIVPQKKFMNIINIFTTSSKKWL